MSTTIVVPLPGPRASRPRVAERAIPFAKALARRLGGKVALVSVVDLPVELSAYYAFAAAEGQVPGGPGVERQEYLNQLAAGFDTIPVETIVRYGDPADEVIDVVDGLESPLLVLASHARSGAGRAILGSVAFSIVHGVRCPILIVRSEHPAIEKPALPERGTVVVPLDGSPSSEVVLDGPLSLLGRADFAVHLVYVVVPGTEFAGIPTELYLREQEEWASEYLQQMARKVSALGYSVAWSVRLGGVADQVLSVAEETAADLIAMATHGRGGIGRLLFGSVAERIAHESTIPLLLIHPEHVPATQEQKPEPVEVNAGT